MHKGNKLIIINVIGEYEEPSYRFCKCSDCGKNFNIADNQDMGMIKFCPCCGKEFTSQYCFEVDFYKFKKNTPIEVVEEINYEVESKNLTVDGKWKLKRHLDNKADGLRYLEEVTKIAEKQMKNPNFPNIIYRLIVRKGNNFVVCGNAIENVFAI